MRYADSGGFEFDVDRPEAWRYRDYVVNAFNEDKPYDRFVREQIAGDEYAPDSDEAHDRDRLPAPRARSGGGGERGRQDALDDIVIDDVADVHGHDGRLRALPQSQVRSDSAEGLLPHPGGVLLDPRPSSYPAGPAHEVDAHKAETARIDELPEPLQAGKAALEAPYLKRLVDAGDREAARVSADRVARRRADKRTEGQRLNAAQIEKTLQNDTLRGQDHRERSSCR